jgi:hypothetical protein
MRADEQRGLTVLRVILAASIMSTAIHYTHNFIAVNRYPGPGGSFDTVIRVAIVIVWPLLTLIGLTGYRRYREGRYHEARMALAAYSITGLTTILHFIYGNPKIPAFFYISIFTDTLSGLCVALFVVWSVKTADSGLQSSTP